MRTPRFTADHRRQQIVASARNLSKNGALYNWTLEDVAQMIDISIPAIKYYFGSAQSLRIDVIRQAVKEKDLEIIIQAVAKYDPLIADMPATLRRKVEKRIRQPDLFKLC